MDETENRMPDVPEDGALSFAEERLRLEREALAVERERLAAARAHAAAEASLLQRPPRPVLAYVSVLLLVLLAGTIGFLAGMAVMENRQKREREERLAKALSQINATVSTNTPSALPDEGRPAAMTPHRNVSVVVIQ
jgi:hypothetical protein